MSTNERKNGRLGQLQTSQLKLELEIFAEFALGYGEKNAIMSFGFEEAQELVDNPKKLKTESQKVIDFVREYNHSIGVTPEVSEMTSRALSTDSKFDRAQNVILHEAQHLLKVPESIKEKTKAFIFPIGGRYEAYRSVSFRESKNIPLCISSVSGYVSGFNLEEDLTLEQTVEMALAPLVPSREDMQIVKGIINQLSSNDPRRDEWGNSVKFYEELLEIFYSN